MHFKSGARERNNLGTVQAVNGMKGAFLSGPDIGDGTSVGSGSNPWLSGCPFMDVYSATLTRSFPGHVVGDRSQK
jgi:hypothetical protein